jgi:hypothetical protein
MFDIDEEDQPDNEDNDKRIKKVYDAIAKNEGKINPIAEYDIPLAPTIHTSFWGKGIKKKMHNSSKGDDAKDK